MVTDQQVVVLRQKLMEGKTQQAAAASAAMSKRSARKWQRGSLPSESKKASRRWRSRPDPFADVWASDVVPLLRTGPEGELSATTILEWLDERHPGRFGRSQLRTLQRRIRDYRALHGPDREVYFQQEHPPGREAQVDFTHCTELGVTIGGESFRHLLFHLVLSHSGWRYAEVCFGETFGALVQGLQGALWELGGVPRVVRTDNLSAATHDLKNSSSHAMNARYEAVLTHYGVESTRTNPRSSHENGVVEQGHRRLKNALDQALILRGGRDFESGDEYRQFVGGVVDRRNRLVDSKLKAERRHLRPLPPAPVPGVRQLPLQDLEIARARFVPVHKGADWNPATHLPPPLEPPATTGLLSHRSEQPVHGTGARREQPLSHTWVQAEMTVSLQGLHHAGQCGLQPLAADPVRSFPHHDQRLSHRLAVDATASGNLTFHGFSTLTQQPDGMLPVAARQSNELIQLLVLSPFHASLYRPRITPRTSVLVAVLTSATISMPP